MYPGLSINESTDQLNEWNTQKIIMIARPITGSGVRRGKCATDQGSLFYSTSSLSRAMSVYPICLPKMATLATNLDENQYVWSLNSSDSDHFTP